MGQGVSKGNSLNRFDQGGMKSNLWETRMLGYLLGWSPELNTAELSGSVTQVEANHGHQMHSPQ